MTPQITFGRVVRAEWTKLRSLRSTWYTLGAASVLTVGIAGAVGYGIHRSVRDGAAPPTVGEAVAAALLPIDLMTLVIGVFGVLLMTGEYGSGLIRATLAAVPRRLPVLLAKALVLATVTAVVMAVASLLSFLVCQAFIGDDGASLGDPGVVRAIAGATASTVAMGLVGLGFGAMLRHTAGAITTLVAVLLVVPALLPPLLSERLQDAIVPYAPVVAGQAMYAVGPNSNPFETLSPGASGLVLLGWVVGLLAGGAAVLHRRDA